jgi:hypothetical protein
MNKPMLFKQRRFLWAALILLASPFSFAHLVETGHGTVNLVDKQAYVLISIPMAAFTDADDNADGLIDGAELKAHQSSLIGQVKQGVRLLADSQSGVWTDMVLTLAPPADRTNASVGQLIAMGAASFGAKPRILTLDYALWPRLKDSSQAANSAASPPAERVTLKVSVTRTQEGEKSAEEIGLLTQQSPQWTFFAPIYHHVLNFALHGFDHIMGGADHLVFLVALLASGIFFRRWVALLTTFTLAHGITFALASFGWVQVSASVVEPAIAISIILVAGLHLLKCQVRLGWELVLVFGLGLVHGLGFASAMQEEGTGQLVALSPFPVWSILGFNLGIEAGQCTVAVLLYLAIGVFRRCFSRQQDVIWQKAAGVIALVMGAFWLVERTF